MSSTSSTPSRGRSTASASLIDLWLGVEDLEHLVERGRGRLDRVVELRQLLHRLEQARQQQHDGDHGADRHLPVLRQPASCADRDRRGEHTAELDHAEVPGRDFDAPQVGVVQRPVGAPEAAVLLGFAGVGLDHPHPGDVLLQRRQIVTDPLADGQVGLVRLTLESNRGNRYERQHEQRQQRELPRHDQQHRQRQRDQQSSRDELQQAPLHELAHRFDVGRHARHQHAGLVAVEEGQRLALDVPEQTQPQRPQESFAGDVDVDVLLAAAEIGDDRHHDIQADRQVERPGIVLTDATVDAVAQQQRSDHRRTGRHGDEHERLQRRAPKRQGETCRSSQHLLGLVTVETVLLADGMRRPHVSRPLRPTGPAPGQRPAHRGTDRW